MSIRRLLWIEWCGKLGFQILSLILKFPVINNILLILASVFYRSFKADCTDSE